jgi:hypothetical protein
MGSWRAGPNIGASFRTAHGSWRAGQILAKISRRARWPSLQLSVGFFTDRLSDGYTDIADRSFDTKG